MAGSSVRLVEIVRHEESWKGTWYRTGQRHFVRQHRAWPKVCRQRWEALTPGVCGGINESDCRLIRGAGAWIACRLFAVKHSIREKRDGR